MHSNSGKFLVEDSKINVHIDCYMYQTHRLLVWQKTQDLWTTALQNLLFQNGFTSVNYCNI